MQGQHPGGPPQSQNYPPPAGYQVGSCTCCCCQHCSQHDPGPQGKQLLLLLLYSYMALYHLAKDWARGVPAAVWGSPAAFPSVACCGCRRPSRHRPGPLQHGWPQREGMAARRPSSTPPHSRLPTSTPLPRHSTTSSPVSRRIHMRSSTILMGSRVPTDSSSQAMLRALPATSKICCQVTALHLEVPSQIRQLASRVGSHSHLPQALPTHFGDDVEECSAHSLNIAVLECFIAASFSSINAPWHEHVCVAGTLSCVLGRCCGQGPGEQTSRLFARLSSQLSVPAQRLPPAHPWAEVILQCSNCRREHTLYDCVARQRLAFLPAAMPAMPVCPHD